jgi:oxygen-independent coproporphyrinogen-3 oxidase
MFQLKLLPSEALIKFDRLLPVSNWSYPVSREIELIKDRYRPYFITASSQVLRTAIYIHIPFCQTICNFCPFHRDRYHSGSEIEQYLSALFVEIDLKQQYMGRPQVDAVFVGGGTPSLLSPSQIASLGQVIHRNFDLRDAAEFTFEVEVKSLSRDKAKAMRDIGVNRVSFGAQTFSEKYRALFSLDATTGQITDAAALLNDVFSYTNVDLLYGMPGETIDDLHTDLAEVMQLNTTTIDAYPINNFAAQRSMHSRVAQAGLDYLPAATRLQLRIYLDWLLREHGYATISGYSYAPAVSTEKSLQGIIQHSPKFLYHDILYGYDSDRVIGYGSSALSHLRGYNLFNFINRHAYARELLINGELPHLSFGPIAATERGIVSFPYRGALDKSKIAWIAVPEETLTSLQEVMDAELVTDRGAEYEVTRLGWLFYVNLMYYLMPTAGKEWLSSKIEHQRLRGRTCGDADLTTMLGSDPVRLWASVNSQFGETVSPPERCGQTK